MANDLNKLPPKIRYALIYYFEAVTHLDLGIYEGKKDDIFIFLHWLTRYFWTNEPVPEYTVHSANPTGVANICAFMDSWKKSTI